MSTKGKILSLNISKEKGTVKYPVSEVIIDEHGIISDAHCGSWNRQVSLLSNESIEEFSKSTKKKITYGEFAENITTSGIDLKKVQILDHFKIGEVELEVRKIGKECHKEGCAIYKAVGKCIMPKEGIFCKVIKTGKIKTGDFIEHKKRVLKIWIITLSDRAFAKKYEDQSGQKAKELITDFFKNNSWDIEINTHLLPDETELLLEKLTDAIIDNINVVFTLGGTGISPRDITSDAVFSICDKTIPGIMENIRLKYGTTNPYALLSRSVAGVAGKTQIYALPGSVKAVSEYLSEIFKTLEHAVFMMNGLGH